MNLKNTLLILAFVFPFVGISQNNNLISESSDRSQNWDLGIFLGLSQHGGDIQSWGKDGESLLNQSNLAYGININYNTSDHFALRLNLLRSKLKGTDAQIENEFATGHDQRGFSFESDLMEFSLVGQYNILKSSKKWTPYILGGVGLSFTDPLVDFNNTAAVNINRADAILQDIEDTKKTNLQIPVGLGLRFDLSNKIYLGVEASSRLPISDYLDGISITANPDKNDAYHFVGVNLGFNLNTVDKDRDNDGIKDAVDACPDTPGSINGCPDRDSDGIIDSEDDCPSVSGVIAFKGCPDSDNDGIADKYDKCPELVGTKDLGGCPDGDGDGISDINDKCPNDFGPASNGGCPENDTDKDGFTNNIDQCPDTPGTLNGCPDSDKDNIIDSQDNCPNVYGTIGGCPDSDNDGIADKDDKCPREVGTLARNGCPETPKVIIQEREVIINNFKIRDIHFKTNSAGLTTESQRRIDETVLFANQYPSAIFHIGGYTDDVGKAESNLSLSQRRAEIVYNTLIARGIPSSRLAFAGYGETDFIDSNSTEAGRFNNRRVEIRASMKK